MKKKTKYVYICISLLCVVLFYFFTQEYKKNKEIEENEEYPLIYNSIEEYKGQIISFMRSKSRRETFLVELSSK